jgi:GNAT superfamily N-acetyltransferase
MNKGDSHNLVIRWCTNSDDAACLGHFFAANIDPEYISHSELQGPRALAPGQWNPNLASIFEREIATRVGQGRGRIARSEASYAVLVAEQGGRLLGLALISFIPTAPVPYGIIEDIVVDASDRNHGLGKRILDWVEQEARSIGCLRLFLESGAGNEGAHHFFERQGFKTCSVVMMRQLPERN